VPRMLTVYAEYDRFGTLQTIESTWNDVVGKYVRHYSCVHESGQGSSSPPHGIYISTPNDSSSIVVLQAFTLKIYICESAMAYSLAKSMRPAHWVQHYCEIEYEGHTHH